MTENALFDPAALRDEFRHSNLIVSQRARWCADDPGAEPNTCRYCGKHWQHWAGSKLDGHGACIVTEDFKHRVGAILKAVPRLSYSALAEILGVTPGVVRSWAFSAGIAGPVDHALRHRREKP